MECTHASKKHQYSQVRKNLRYERLKLTKEEQAARRKEKAAYRKALDAGYEPDETDQEHLKALLGDEYQQK
jgi:hypothetical protein